MSESGQPTLLIVDDEPANLAVLSRLLLPHYRVRAATSGAKALEAALRPPVPDLILLDVMMPDMNGYAVLDRLMAESATRDIPVIFVTALSDEHDEERGLDRGAVDYITKPIKPAIVLARVKAHLELKRARDRLRDQNAWLETEVSRRMEENALTEEVGIRALAHLAETRDPETGNHILRTQAYVRHLAGLVHQATGALSERQILVLTRSAPLHDIGKVGIPDSILRKPGPLLPEEWTIMRRHTSLGFEAITLAERDARRQVEFLAVAKEIARWHHERWSGDGYPDGLAGEAIPLSARLMAVADVFDALISSRVYKAPMSFAEARKLVESERGGQFDPVLAGLFLDNFDDFVAIAEAYQDAQDSPGR